MQPFEKRKVRQQVHLKQDNNLKELTNAMKMLGFKPITDKLSRHLSQGQRNFSIPLTY